MEPFNIINPYVNEIYALGLNSTIYLYFTGGPDKFEDVVISFGNRTPAVKAANAGEGQMLMTDINGNFSFVKDRNGKDTNIKRFEWKIPKDFSKYPTLPKDFYFTPEDEYFFHIRYKQEPTPDWRYSGFFRIV